MSSSPPPESAVTDAPRLFGTDGIRGKAGHPPLDEETVRRIGAALVRALPAQTHPIQLLIGRDTRESGTWIERALAEGAAGQGAMVTTAGVVPTPAIAYLTGTAHYDAGIVISASHNPFEDNGIKVFSGDGIKLTGEFERRVERIVADASWQPPIARQSDVRSADLVEGYLEHLRAVWPDAPPFASTRIVLDCANGATSVVAPQLFRSLGFDPVVIADTPDGRNINLECGSTHPGRLAESVVRERAAIGIAFDGDGDRAIFVDEAGRIVDGDAVLLMCARQLREEGRLRGDAIVATVMSNIGLELALKALGIGLVRCAVGDKYVMEEMQAQQLSLGGEQSGHIIFADYLFTGDGLCTAVNVLRTVCRSGRPLGSLAGDLITYPQVLVNVRVTEKKDVGSVPAIAAAIADVESKLAGQGRLLVRYSGTEPLLRIMLEGRDQTEIRQWADEIAGVVRRYLGA